MATSSRNTKRRRGPIDLARTPDVERRIQADATRMREELHDACAKTLGNSQPPVEQPPDTPDADLRARREKWHQEWQDERSRSRSKRSRNTRSSS